MLPKRLLPLCLLLLLPLGPAHGQKTTAAADKKEELTLEKLFPKKGLFGPSAQGMAFAHAFEEATKVGLKRPPIAIG